MISDGTFGKDEHLLKTKDFRRAYAERPPARDGAFALYRVSGVPAKSRIGFSISSRVMRQAVRRNRIRRLLRESFRKNKAKIKTGFDIVLTVKRAPPTDMRYKDVEAAFLALAKRAGILTSPGQ